MMSYVSNRLAAGQQLLRVSGMAAAAATVALIAPFSASADSGTTGADDGTIQVSSLEVRSRIASMERVNVTAEKPLRDDDDAQVAAASAAVSELLAELEQLEESQRSE